MATKKAKSTSKTKAAATKSSKAKTSTSALERAKAETFTKQAPKPRLFMKRYPAEEDTTVIFQKPAFIGALVAEIIGVFLLAIVFLAIQASPLYVLFALVAVSVAVYAFSGAHLNPIITVGAAVTRRISPLRALFYIIAQVIGAMLAYVVLKSFMSAAPEVSDELAMMGMGATPTLFSMAALPEGLEMKVLSIEFFGAAIFALFFARAIRYRKSVFTFASTVGLGLFVALVFAFTAANFLGGGGFALNPALAVAMEAFNSDVVPLNWAILIYALIPLLGGVVGFMLHDIIAVSTDDLEA